MKLFYRKRMAKAFAIITLFSILSNLLFPSVAYALTGGPTQPEFSSFEPVATTNMVNEFTGDFTYNLPILEVPGPNGSGYPMSLSYHSGTTPEEEASWVGYGWTLNPGAITRNTRGFPDEYNGSEITYHNKVPDNWTVTVGSAPSLEVFSIDLALNKSVRYNNYRGFGYNLGLGVGLGKGVVSLGYNISDGDGSFSLNVNPMSIMSLMQNNSKENKNNPLDATSIKEVKVHYNPNVKGLLKGLGSLNLLGSQYGLFSYSEVVRPTQVAQFSGTSNNISFGLNGTFSFLEIGLSANIFGSFTQQSSTPSTVLNAYGYMYSGNAEDDDEAIMDYYVEKETPYHKRDQFLGMPFNNADNFIVSGEGLGGGFRLYDKKIGQFRPNKVENITAIGNMSFEVELGSNLGGGSDIGAGINTMKIGDWDKSISTFKDEEGDIDEKLYFRFNNDLGGSIEHSTGDTEISARIERTGNVPGKKTFIPKIDHIKSDLGDEPRTGRSSYIAYNSNKEIYEAINGAIPKRYNVHSLREDLNTLANRNSYQESIGEIVTYNESGLKYVYGLPVYSKEEQNLQFGLKGVPEEGFDKNKYLVYYKNEGYIKVGEERKDAYASTFLLTEITTADYVDRTLNGPTEDDFGGYTRFNYVKQPSWYDWKIPYNGYIYHRNSLSDVMDDMASVSKGQKEIYYLESVETKTHIARFITGDRTDGKEASTNETSTNAQGTDGLKKLISIKLYSKDELKQNSGAKPIKTVHFRYTEDYDPTKDLCQEVSNGISGKLTLEKVWFEYQGLNEGIADAKISPYVFGYSYPSLNNYPEKYRTFDGYPSSETDQNPDYSPFSTDAWGNYQRNELDANQRSLRHINMQSWLDQTPVQFDPAAWQLKVIKLPTGGEIHVQYEQDDYCYVQNEEAHVMVNLLFPEGEDQNKDQENNKYFLNTDEIGITSGEAKENLVDMIEKKYLLKEKIYFKFLYKLLGKGQPQIDDCNAEYIKGYTDVTGAGIENGKVFIQLSPESNSDHIPRKVCRDFIKAERAGRIQMRNCNGTAVGIDPHKDPLEIVKQFKRFEEAIKVPSNTCADINYSLSYFRIPTPLSKKGGGLRVKRLLMYDNSLEGSVLYGNEYHYKVYDSNTGTIRSSGVATNEPVSIREENILVKHIERKHQKKANRIISGRDKKQSEGPLGETILPAPSVGYSKVTIKNIHSGNTNPGFTVKEFYTAFDFPVKARRTDIKAEKDYLPLPLGLININVNNHWASQGFSFILNEMHGQVRRIASYGGDIRNIDDVIALTKVAASSEQIFEYFKPGEEVPMVDEFGVSPVLGNPGKEVDITFAQSKIQEELYDLSVEFDVDVGYIPPAVLIFFVSAFPSLTANKSELYTHTTTKVIRYPAILKKVISTQDGVTHTTENLAFDKYTGRPVAVKSYDDYAGAYLAQEIPASWEYENMKPKALNEGRTIKEVSYTSINGQGYIGFNSENNCELAGSFSKGDLVVVTKGTLSNFYHVSGFDFAQDRLKIVPVQGNGNQINSDDLELTILRSGRTNQLNANVGNITFHRADGNLNVNVVPEKEVYISNSFTTDLNSALSGKNGQGTFILSGTYQNFNINNFITYLPPNCSVNADDATIKEVEFWYKNNEGEMELGMSSFKVLCGTSTWITIGPQ